MDKNLTMLKSQDLLLLFKMASLHAQDALSGSSSIAWGGLSSIDLLDEDCVQEPQAISTPPRDELWSDISVTIKRIIDAESFGWAGWQAVDDTVSVKSEVSWADRYTVRALSGALGLSKSEISNSLARCREAGLVKNDYETSLPNVNRLALLRITEHALKYFFPARIGTLVRGIPTGFSAPVLSRHLKSAGSVIYVWPDPQGTERGQAVEPLYKSVPAAVKADRTLYHYMALVDSIRMGGPREVEVAVQLLKKGMGL